MKFDYSITLYFSWVLICIILKLFRETGSTSPQKNTMVLAHVIFRHGQRTPNGPEELYPKDPYLNETYFPVGLGQLTLVGKRGEYFLGKTLRNRYNKFLGPYYYPEIVESKSTDYNRTKMSLQLVLAGLFPPNNEEIWYPGLNWQPIPYNYEDRSKDKVLLGTTCPNYEKLYDEYVNSTEHQVELKKRQDTFNYISKNTGLNVTTYKDIFNLYFGLTTEEEWGFKLPKWTEKVWPKTITQLAIKDYFVSTATKDLKKMASGYLLQKIIDDTNKKIDGSDEIKNRKMYLYSAHENNIAELLITLGIFPQPHIPPYGAYVSLEVHKMKNSHGIKIYYENYSSKKPLLLKLPGCNTICEIKKFISLVGEYLPITDLCGFKNN